ncbi:hypothetical protein CKN73_07495 [Carnobacterium divergens]|uniref:DnaD domain-containing protein n=1 Tax=Carnobacterium divergens TaxID=2748 RepID=UPI001072DCF4|nr:DnaD domain protein [Carnobacterium divergens]TFJ40157.1 hypothetical protein CKN77_07595 [Carnobacterium divergens]TFJ48778.1 hypothetical protein CKN73_07495 [Carnobacterium divergens]TFJ54042.1 hypothetical protein CKN83_07400 [Carnobacterium divergens]TFJ59568.1 hypothetical protein CKN89_07840 [Carnobacterium divergens]TFJ70212.1 hypothetical protein CKN91_07455 [Carnobacterium divergens]
MEGFIQVHRKMQDSIVFQNPYYYKLWSYLMFKARFKPGKIFIGNQEVQLDINQLVWGRKEATAELNQGISAKEKKSESTWENYLKKFEKMGILNRKVNSKFTVVTLTDDWFIKSEDEESSQEFSQQVNSSLTSSYQQLNNNLTQKKNVNNVFTSSTANLSNINSTSAGEMYELAFPKKPMNQVIAQSIAEWINDFGGQEEIVCLAIKNAAEYSADNFKYAENTMKRWEMQGVKTVEDAQALIDKFDQEKNRKIEQEMTSKASMKSTGSTMKVPLHNWLEN